MRFPQLPIGQRFSFKGKTYTKTGPLTASEEESGKSQLIMKSAEVTPLDLAAQAVTEKQLEFSQAEVMELFEQYRTNLRNTLLGLAEQHASLPIEEVMIQIDALELPFATD